MQTLPIIFRAERSGLFKGDVTAVFPTLPGTNDRHTFTCYAHQGQHSAASRDWYNQTRAATPAEYASLLRELAGIYDDCQLTIAKRFTRHHDAQRFAALA